jgi:hypothetical protein
LIGEDCAALRSNFPSPGSLPALQNDHAHYAFGHQNVGDPFIIAILPNDNPVYRSIHLFDRLDDGLEIGVINWQRVSARAKEPAFSRYFLFTASLFPGTVAASFSLSMHTSLEPGTFADVHLGRG